MAIHFGAHNRALMTVFNFNEQDLNDNRGGRLSSGQVQQMHYPRLLTWLDWLALATLFCLPAAAFTAIYVQYRTRFGYDDEMLFLWGAGVVLFMGVLLIFGWLIMGQDLMRSHIRVTEGRPTTAIVPVKSRYGIIGNQYIVKIGRVRFFVESEMQLQAFNPDLVYRVHFWPTPPNHRILSVEAVT